MKNHRIFILALYYLFLSSPLSAQLTERTTVLWAPDTLNFGKIEAGTIVLDSFKVTNTGVGPYTIREVKANCDCTVFRYPKKALMPGESTSIRIEFDSKGKLGSAMPGIIVYDNSIPNSRHILYLKGEVTPRKEPKKLMESKGL